MKGLTTLQKVLEYSNLLRGEGMDRMWKKPGKEELSSSMEDYLEAIYVLAGEEKAVRIKGISDRLGVKKSSVNNAVKVLSRKGLVRHEKYGTVILTPSGVKMSKKIKGRHDMLVRFLSEILGVDRVLAAEDACKVEHAISPGTSEKLTKFLKFVDSAPSGADPEWLENFRCFVVGGNRQRKSDKTRREFQKKDEK
jgi:DtxR family transcriptional regulator, Mn-dependent transcriptional regulator